MPMPKLKLKLKQMRDGRTVALYTLTLTLTLVAGAALLLSSGCAVWRVSQSAELASRSQPFQQLPAQPSLRLLVVGDSTAVGTGADTAAQSVAGLLAKDRPRLLIENRARDGDKFADVLAQLDPPGRFDIVLVQAGGNDIIRFTDMDSLRGTIDAVARRAAVLGDQVLLMPAGNVGNAPFFFAPWSWLMTRRAREMHTAVREVAQRRGASYVNLFHERGDDPFVRDPSLNANDGLHPSSAGYRVWFDQLVQQAGLDARLAADEPR